MEDETINSVIWITHEESYSDGRTIGVVTNFDLDKNLEKIDSFIYYFREDDDSGMYVFFETIVDLNDYILYGDKKVKRAYMKESQFDFLLDSDNIKDSFNKLLKWM